MSLETLEITAANMAKMIDSVIQDCLLSDQELARPDAHKMVVVSEGIVTSYGFHPGRLQEHKANVARLLERLPPPFFSDEGGGWSFLQACVDRDGERWGEHQSMEALFCLSNALGLSAYLVPRETWRKLPGGMPYIEVKADNVREAKVS